MADNSSGGSSDSRRSPDWRSTWDARRSDIDNEIAGGLQQGRSIDDTFSDVSRTTAGWFDQNDPGALDATDYNSQFREYYDSRIDDMERGQRLSRLENGSFDLNPNWTDNQTNAGTTDNRLAEGLTSERDNPDRSIGATTSSSASASGSSGDNSAGPNADRNTNE
jgi:hypothetical protein